MNFWIRHCHGPCLLGHGVGEPRVSRAKPWEGEWLVQRRYDCLQSFINSFMYMHLYKLYIG